LRIFDKARLLKGSVLLIIYLFLFFGSWILFSDIAHAIRLKINVDLIVFLTFLIPLTFFLFSLLALFTRNKFIIWIDLIFYIFLSFFLFLIFNWRAFNNPFLMIKFVFIIILYIKLLPFIFYFRKILRVQVGFDSVKIITEAAFLISIVFFASLTFLDNWSRNLSGDEPHYLLAAHSLIHDGDFDLANNYRDKDYRVFYRSYLSSRNADDHDGWKMISQLGWGFPLIITPGYALLGRLGAQLTLNIIASLTLVNLILILLSLFKERRGLTLIFSSFLLSSPFIIYSKAIYPEMLIALIITYFIRIILSKKNIDKSFIILSLFLSLLLLVTKIKSAFILLTILFYLVHKFVKSRKKFVEFSIIVLLVFIYFPLVDYFIFGKVFYDKILGYILGILTKSPKGILGLLFDQEAGLILQAPIFFIPLVELLIILGIKKEKDDRLRALGILFIVNYVFIGLWQLWHGLSTPSPRYLLPFLPLFMIFLARAWERRKGFSFDFINTIFFTLTIIYGFFINLNTDFWYNWCDGSNTLFELLSNFIRVDFLYLFPTFIVKNRFFWWQIIWIVIFIFFTGLIFIKKSQPFAGHITRTKKEILLSTFGIILITIVLGFSFGFCVNKLPTHIVELESKNPDIFGVTRRYPLKVDPWYGGRYLKGNFDNGIILYPEERVNINVKLKSNLQEIDIYLFRGKGTYNEPMLEISLDGVKDQDIYIETFEWGKYMMLKPTKVNFSTMTFENVSEYDDDENPKAYGIVIDKVEFKYKSFL
jgi:hypothetical protein